MEQQQESVPKPSNRVPNVGDVVYLPSRPGPDLFHGGRTTVLAVERKRRATIRVEADPDQWITWFDVANEQYGLWLQLGAQCARKATPQEIQTFHEEVARKKAEATEAERRKWLPKAFAVLNGALLEVPVWEDSHRAKNWAAIVEVNGTAPGGLQRSWFNRGRGPAIYIVPPHLEVGDVVEFGADYVRYSGRRDTTRWYGVVTEISVDRLLIRPYPSARDALLATTSG